LQLQLQLQLPLLLILLHPPRSQRPNAGVAQWASRHGCRDSRVRPWMAGRGGPTEQCRSEGTPSLSEGPNGGAKPFASFSASGKGTRRKGETISSRYRSNGYVHPNSQRRMTNHRKRARSYRGPAAALSGRYRSNGYVHPNSQRRMTDHREQARSHRDQAKKCPTFILKAGHCVKRDTLRNAATSAPSYPPDAAPPTARSTPATSAK
jgi:hypothetical protein